MLSSLKNDKAKIFLLLWIIAGHLYVQLSGIFHFDFNPHIYWFPDYAYENDFIKNIWHYHVNPPLINFVAGLLYKLHIPLYLFCAIIYPLLQIIASFWLIDLIRKMVPKYGTLLVLILLANPMHFVWFSFYYYPALIFFLSAYVLKTLFSDKTELQKFNTLAIVLVTISMFRASYHPVWIIALLALYKNNLSLKQRAFGLLLLLIPLGWYTKNYLQFGFWSGSSLAGQNISAHYPNHLRQKIVNFNSHGRYMLVGDYDGLYAQNDPVIIKYWDDKFLNDPMTLHNVRTIPISKGYWKETTDNFDIRYSALTIGYGIFSYLGSPSIDEYNNKSDKPFFWNNSLLIDWLDLPNHKVGTERSGYSVIRFSWATFIYPVAFLMLLLRYRSLPFNFKVIFIWLFFVSFIYCTIDPNEAARMRYETEPLWWISSIYIFGRIINKLRTAE